MSSWPIQLKQGTNGATVLAGHATGVPPISGKLGVLQIDVPYNAPGLATGIPIGKRSPVAPEIILAAWFDLPIPWDADATTPKGDIYTPKLMTDVGKGLIALSAGNPAAMRPTAAFDPGGLRYNNAEFFFPSPGSFSPVTLLNDPNIVPPIQPWYYVVSSDGTPTGGDPGASHGHAMLNILLASPV